MIHVKVRAEDISPEWLEKAHKLTDALLACVDDGPDVLLTERLTAKEKRRKILDKHDSVWKELKDVLASWSYGKCWYSELRELGSDYHVDHFRPKGRVKNDGEAERDGYWWLAFDWLNYRLAVSWCNSKHRDRADGEATGKADQFPLKPGTSPISIGGDVEAESPVLLDPTRERDVLLLDFDETGLPVPSAAGWNAERVMATRRILHLDAERMVDARRQVWRDCMRRLRKADEAINAPATLHTVQHDKTAEDLIEEICQMLRPDAELSAVAHACVLKSKYIWAKRLPSHPLASIAAPAVGQ